MLNNIVLTGRLTKDSEISQTTQKNIKRAAFSIAVARDYNKEKTDFINIIAWRNTAEFIEKYFTKGMPATIKGRLETNGYKDKESGENRKSAYVTAEQVYFAESKRKESENTGQWGYGGENNNFTEITADEDLPF